MDFTRGDGLFSSAASALVCPHTSRCFQRRSMIRIHLNAHALNRTRRLAAVERRVVSSPAPRLGFQRPGQILGNDGRTGHVVPIRLSIQGLYERFGQRNGKPPGQGGLHRSAGAGPGAAPIFRMPVPARHNPPPNLNRYDVIKSCGLLPDWGPSRLSGLAHKLYERRMALRQGHQIFFFIVDFSLFPTVINDADPFKRQGP